MKSAAWGLAVMSMLVLLVVVGVGPAQRILNGTAQAAEDAGKPSALPALTVDKDSPLLLDSLEEKPKKKPKGPMADNSACHVCHTNYEEETLARVHAEAEVGCVKCHGESVAHRNDEDNITPPDIMFAADGIDKACIQCHETHDAPARKVIDTWQKRCPAKEDPDALVCTDCHGEHRMTFRTVWWDKRTRKLANRQGERVKYAPDLTQKPTNKAPASQGHQPKQ
jgi:hypothetical protein